MTHASVTELWNRFRDHHKSAPVDAPEAYYFCDNKADADACAQLVVEGRKQATAGAFVDLEFYGEELAQVGQYFVITDFEGVAKAVIQITSVKMVRFGDIDEDFARAEGEGDLTLDWWRTAHRAFFERSFDGRGIPVDDELMVVCERFETLMVAEA